jgi:hypothetical protein
MNGHPKFILVANIEVPADRTGMYPPVDADQTINPAVVGHEGDLYIGPGATDKERSDFSYLVDILVDLTWGDKERVIRMSTKQLKLLEAAIASYYFVAFPGPDRGKPPTYKGIPIIEEDTPDGAIYITLKDKTDIEQWASITYTAKLVGLVTEREGK